tara:strand:+ start:98 stop:313 length:216 start_codon:yes stop_codon:yes gene_type:complete
VLVYGGNMSYTVRVTKVKKMFNQEKVQISTDVLNLIDQKIAFKLRLIVKKCKDHNIKRLTEEVYPYVERML